ncbi:hypothetical protein BPAE_0037g00410 [Botrytis paeoniae]|uniref:Uncharacterized protein n=1 Tax=Botrytis paeoniae TaxID=278948 RepID=A0A4Z1G0Y0_9HELO|nr:hypothetical protein BPAE_0037g00410 [Botrytis paeoniae]
MASSSGKNVHFVGSICLPDTPTVYRTLNATFPTQLKRIPDAIEPAYQEAVEPVYAKALLKAVRRIQDEIPAEDLAIQWDVAVEFAFLEGIVLHPPHWIMALKDSIVNRVLELADAIDPSVELGFHFCYGDLGHQHFTQPKDMSLLVDIANRVLTGTRRRRSVN